MTMTLEQSQKWCEEILTENLKNIQNTSTSQERLAYRAAWRQAWYKCFATARLHGVEKLS